MASTTGKIVATVAAAVVAVSGVVAASTTGGVSQSANAVVDAIGTAASTKKSD